MSCEETALLSYLDRVFSTLTATGDADHEYVLRPSIGGEDAAYQLVLDGVPLRNAPVAEGLVGSLVHDATSRGIATHSSAALHAGGLEHAGSGIALPGAQTAGKTTLTAGLVRAGLGYLSDEAVPVDANTLQIRPVPKPLSLDPGAWPLFPELEPHADLPTDEYKRHQWQVPADAIRPDPLGQPCRVDLIVFPRHQPGAETKLEPVRRAEALVELAKHTFRFAEQASEALEMLADIVRGATCYRLTTGELDTAVKLVLELVGAP